MHVNIFFHLIFGKQIWIAQLGMLNISKRDRLSVPRPRGWTPRRRNTTYGLCVAKNPSFLMSFCSPSYFSANDFFFFCFCLAPYSRTSFSSCTFFNFPYFTIVLSRTFPPKILLIWGTLQVPPVAYFLSHLSTLSSHILSCPSAFPYPVLPFVFVLTMLVPHFSSQNSVEHARSRSLLQRTSFSSPLPSLPYFPILWILSWFYGLYCVCNAFGWCLTPEIRTMPSRFHQGTANLQNIASCRTTWEGPVRTLGPPVLAVWMSIEKWTE